MRHRFLRGEVLLALGVIALGFLFIAGTMAIPVSTSGYSRVGPADFPWGVSIALLVIGGFLLREALSGKWVGEGSQPDAPPFVLGPFLWISLGLIQNLLLMEPAGFVVASAALFVCTAYGFGARNWIVTALIAVVLSLVTYLGFSYGLDVGLPPGLLQGIV
ncbi:MAG TPA: tripartite tricarboxylate transporter TctB family protein [Alphaproteobacteria bacterium]|jgi:putative tricarboxylic transport membrane protein